MEGKTQRGRPRYGDKPRPPYAKFSISMPEDIFKRLCKYCEDEERDRSYPIKQAVDAWLKERGY